MGRWSKRGTSEAKAGRLVVHRSRVATCDKIAYHTRSDAKKAARWVQSKFGRMRPFRCPDCGMWHIGHLPAAVIQNGEPYRNASHGKLKA